MSWEALDDGAGTPSATCVGCIALELVGLT